MAQHYEVWIEIVEIDPDTGEEISDVEAFRIRHESFEKMSDAYRMTSGILREFGDGGYSSEHAEYALSEAERLEGEEGE